MDYQRVYAEIDLDVIEENLEQMKKNLHPETKIMAVIKMDGYGHGSIPIAHMMEKKDFLSGYATATIEEAVALREQEIKKPILVLGYTFEDSYETMIQQDISATVFRYDMIEQMSQAAQKEKRNMKVHIKVDTGMNRIGISPDDRGMEFVRKVFSAPGIEVEGILTHFACADEKDLTYANLQLKRFNDFVSRVERELNVKIPLKHCSNSAAIIQMPDANLDIVRAGIILFGLWPSDSIEKNRVLLKPALSWKSHIVYLKELKAGERISYGGTYTTNGNEKIATIPVGYGDGYPRSLSNKGEVLIRGQRAPIVGRVCMDQMMVNVSHIPDVAEGDLVTLIGKQDDEKITAEELGELSGRFNYELVCDINKRVPRVYLKNGDRLNTFEN